MLVSVYHNAAGPLIAIVLVAILAGILRWTYGTGEHPTSRRAASEDGYGLLAVVVTAHSAAHAERMRVVLADQGIRATVTPVPAGFDLLVYVDDLARARDLLVRLA